MSSVGVVIATYGDWSVLDDRTIRAIDSVRNQTVPVKWIHYHGETLASARNTGAMVVDTDYLIFLDADDELDSHYVEEMLKGSGDIRQPSTLGIVDGVEDDKAVLIPKRDLMTSNYIVIGAMCRADLFFQVGGFADYPIFEDWHLWARMFKAGAEIVPCPTAVYRVHVNPKGRNSDQAESNKWYRAIRDAIWTFQP